MSINIGTMVLLFRGYTTVERRKFRILPWCMVSICTIFFSYGHAPLKAMVRKVHPLKDLMLSNVFKYEEKNRNYTFCQINPPLKHHLHHNTKTTKNGHFKTLQIGNHVTEPYTKEV